MSAQQASKWSRFWHMASGWGSVGVVYTLSGWLQGPGTVLPETALDRLISFNPDGIWLYLSFFVIIPVAYFTTDVPRMRWLMRSMQVCAVLCGLVFMLWPTTLVYPEVSGDGISVWVFRLLLAGDSSQNCLPSLHAALTLLSVWALLDRRHPWRSLLAVVCGICICFSIIQLRRHVSIDLAAGLLVGWCSGWLCLQRRPAPHENQAVPS